MSVTGRPMLKQRVVGLFQHRRIPSAQGSADLGLAGLSVAGYTALCRRGPPTLPRCAACLYCLPPLHSAPTPHLAYGGRNPIARNFLSLADFLAQLDVPKSTFFRWKALGEAPRTYKLPNGQLRIRRTDFDAWLSSREEPQAA